uniref:Uncharacterized protein n=1 Tax=Kalanchoe fedtschenkoi TaxID=63787 RepID=A0A7N0V378_KALFE
MEIEVGAQQVSSGAGDSPKRFGLRSSIQTNFGEDYVFQIVSKDDQSLMGVSLSTNVVKFYSPATGQYFGECRGHSGTINEISLADGLDSNLLHSCSSDGTIRVWDVRTFQQVAMIGAGSSQEVFSLSVGGAGNNLLAGGCEAQVHIWDRRNQKRIASLEESHMDDVTQVRFVPGHQNTLVTASVDGLICVFDTASDINEDDHLESVLNVGTSIGKVGFFGETSQQLWCLTHIETLSLWDWKNAEAGAHFHDARSAASASWKMENVDYFVDCHYSKEDNALWVIGGTNSGSLGYFPVSYRAAAPAIGSPQAVLQGGHTGVVRSVLPVSCMRSGPGRGGGIFGWTGGEDGRLCCWSSHESSAEVNRSWVSSELAVKSRRSRQNRHSPY